MQKTILSTDIANMRKSDSLPITLPHQCPHCGKGIEPVFLCAYHIDSNVMPHLFALFFCPVCEMCFVGVYDGMPGYGARFSHVFPLSESISSFPDEIAELSPQFIKIYNQSEKAEHAGLDEICGLGYRKALEFLIKDFAIRMQPDEEESIKAKLLAKCIENHIDHPKIKATAKASAWIGNDEAHYIRKHEDYNLSHLKMFVAATVSYIQSEITLQIATDLLGTQK